MLSLVMANGWRLGCELHLRTHKPEKDFLKTVIVVIIQRDKSICFMHILRRAKARLSQEKHEIKEETSYQLLHIFKQNTTSQERRKFK
ncbi:Uncharacterized protein TCM_031124 [Theobroma cacao]|uniref:Uncharacterized protein n=1 Tax=Theobroma cacao TaxID=3641 RepID=A0A061F5K0_THECC|nr:Uncharacterized protein TCM_031124 [Theobroma cacao]